jgi:hypothetical protein
MAETPDFHPGELGQKGADLISQGFGMLKAFDATREKRAGRPDKNSITPEFRKASEQGLWVPMLGRLAAEQSRRGLRNAIQREGQFDRSLRRFIIQCTDAEYDRLTGEVAPESYRKYGRDIASAYDEIQFGIWQRGGWAHTLPPHEPIHLPYNQQNFQPLGSFRPGTVPIGFVPR